MSVSGIGSNSMYQLLLNSGAAVSARAAATSSTSATSNDGSSTRVPGHLAAAANVLGMSTDDVTKALSAGASLSDLAEEQGVSRDDLVAALVADAPKDMQAMGNVQSMVEGLVDQKGLGPVGQTPSPSGVFGESMTSDQQDTLDTLSALLGTDSTSLVSALRGGTSLADLFSSAGLDLDDVAGAIQEGLLVDTTA